MMGSKGMDTDRQLESLRFYIDESLRALTAQFDAIEKRLANLETLCTTFRGEVSLLKDGLPKNPTRGDMWRMTDSTTWENVNVRAGDLILWDGMKWGVWTSKT